MRMEDQAFALPYWCVDESDTDGEVVAQVAAVEGKRHVITGIIISASGQVAAATTAALSNTLAADVDSMGTIAIPALELQPIVLMFTRPLQTRSGASFEVTLGALGAAIVGRVVVYGYTVSD